MGNSSRLTTAFFVLAVICLFGLPAQAKYGGGSGTEADPYLIEDANDMQAMGADPNYWDAHFKLVNDINLAQFTGTQFNIIGNDSNAFTGVFDGNDNSISNFTYDDVSQSDKTGLFGYIENAEIKSVILTKPNVDGFSSHYTGALVGHAKHSDIVACRSIGGVVRGRDNTGGVVGYLELSDLIETYSTTEVSGIDSVGGLVGYSYSYSNIKDCLSNGVVSGDDSVGGIVGETNWYVNLLGCCSLSSISGDTSVGGVVGYGCCCSDLRECCSLGRVSGNGEVGGLVGHFHAGEIEDCYSVSKVTGGSNVGGLIGEEGGGDIQRNYAAGPVSGTTSVGGFIGSYSGLSPVSGCFWNSEINPGLNGVGNASTPAGIIGKSSENLKKENTFTTEGWDFAGETTNGDDDTWTIEEEACYPIFFWQPVAGDLVEPEGVDFKDYSRLASHFMENNCADSNYCGWADLDFSGQVNITDLMILTWNWLERIAHPYSGGGKGTKLAPYLIANAEDMNEIGLHREHWDNHFLLANDIDMSGYSGSQFNIIGNGRTPFSGVFDGNGWTIRNLTYSTPQGSGISIFAFVSGEDAEIRDLSLSNVTVDAEYSSYVGCLVGSLVEGTVIRCNVKDSFIIGDRQVGGLIGNSYYGEVQSCSASDVRVEGERFVGALIGTNGGVMKSCFSSGEVFGDKWVGGLSGANTKPFSNCVARIEDCYSTADAKVEEYVVGGLIGYNSEGTVKKCFSSGQVSGNYQAGGLVGFNFDSHISDCYTNGVVDANDRVGGLVGTTRESTIEKCYAAALVVCDANVGGLVGYDSEDYISVYNKCFWNSDVNPDVNGIGNYTDPNVIGKTTAQMQTESTFTDASWDFIGETANGSYDIWAICEGTNYPRHVWSIPAADFVCPDGVNFIDFAVFGLAWMSTPLDINWNPVCDISDPNDDIIDGLDLDVFSDNWLTGM